MKRASLVMIILVSCLVVLSFLYVSITGMYSLKFYFGEIPEEITDTGSNANFNENLYSLNDSGQGMIVESEGQILATCSAWGVCENNLQRRECKIYNASIELFNLINLTRPCKDCEEKFICSTSHCVDGFFKLDCTDVNHCGNKDTFPEIACNSLAINSSYPSLYLEQAKFIEKNIAEKNCSALFSCDSWSDCQVDYNFNSIAKEANNLTGYQERLCSDKNACAPNFYEKRKCYLTQDIVTKKFTKCGSEYIFVYDKKTNKLISAMKDNRALAYASFNINLPFEENIACDTCSNGIKDTYELAVDCGGRCSACEKNAFSISDNILFEFSQFNSIIIFLSIIITLTLIFLYLKSRSSNKK